MAWELVTQAECAAVTGYDPTRYDDQWYLWAEARLKRYLRTGTLSESISCDEYYNGNGRHTLRLHNWPIEEVTHLAISGGEGATESAYLAGSFYVDLRSIYLLPLTQTNIAYAVRGDRNIFPRGHRNIHVVYTAGWSGTDPRLVALKQSVREAMQLIINLYARTAARGGSDAALAYAARAEPMGDRVLTFDAVGLHRAILDVLQTTLPSTVLI